MQLSGASVNERKAGKLMRSSLSLQSAVRLSYNPRDAISERDRYGHFVEAVRGGSVLQNSNYRDSALLQAEKIKTVTTQQLYKQHSNWVVHFDSPFRGVGRVGTFAYIVFHDRHTLPNRFRNDFKRARPGYEHLHHVHIYG